jgi:hypothetical protein
MLTDEQNERLLELAYSYGLEAVASGETREHTRGWILDRHPKLDPEDLGPVLDEAYEDALKQGVEREDVDPSWYPA